MSTTRAVSFSEHWSSAADPDLAVTTRGDVAPADVTRAVRAIGRVLRRHHLDLPARVRITAPADRDRPNVVQANVRLPHTQARVQVTGPRGFAVTFAVERLDRQLTRLAARRGREWPDPGGLRRVRGRDRTVRGVGRVGVRSRPPGARVTG
ncbi:hypothetical protein [Nocardia farcinica]|uniref:hypothetical protein n=1 Tax=Nocardia farcinica TaxID=37329 RepID=UPI00313B3365